MRFLADDRLYSETEHSLASLRARSPATTGRARRWRAHLYWRGVIGRKQALAIKSFLATQDPATAELWLWLDAEHGFEDHVRNPLLAPLLPSLRVLPFDPDAASTGTPLEGRSAMWRGLPPVRRSNLVRSLVLFVHGGLYADMDVLFLRDFAPLMHDAPTEFCYRWSADLPYANSAVLALEAGSATSHALLERCVRHGSFRPRDVLRFDDEPDLDLLVLPCPWFDPLWPIRDGRDTTSSAPFRTFDGFFRRFGWRFPAPAAPITLDSFFPGAFAYHWHNGWDAREHEASFFGALERDVNERLARRQWSGRPSGGASPPSGGAADL